MMITKWLMFVVATAAAMGGCATTNFTPSEAQGGDVIEGHGGTKEVVDGMEMWDHGDPPRKFRVLGVLEDDRGVGLFQSAAYRGDIVKKAREAGGDAVVLLSKESQIVGYRADTNATGALNENTNGANGQGAVEEVRRNYSVFAVIRYVE